MDSQKSACAQSSSRDALVLYNSRQYKEAISVCEEEIKSDPSHVDSYVVMCWSLVANREYARAGVWNYLDTPDTLQVSEGALMIHALEAGRKTIRLPQVKTVTDITAGEELGKLDEWTMELKAHETRIFLLD